MKYRILTWDIDEQEYTPQKGVPQVARSWRGLLRACRKLRAMGYEVWRRKHTGWSDCYVKIERED